jgi:hypothetical protein
MINEVMCSLVFCIFYIVMETGSNELHNRDFTPSTEGHYSLDSAVTFVIGEGTF